MYISKTTGGLHAVGCHFTNYCVLLCTDFQGTVQAQSTRSRQDVKLQQTMTLTVKRLDVYQQVCVPDVCVTGCGFDFLFIPLCHPFTLTSKLLTCGQETKYNNNNNNNNNNSNNTDDSAGRILFWSDKISLNACWSANSEAPVPGLMCKLLTVMCSEQSAAKCSKVQDFWTEHVWGIQSVSHATQGTGA